MTSVLIPSALTFREAPAEGVAATLEGVAVPYGQEISLGNGTRESFAPDAFDPAEVVGKPLCWRHDEPIGVITEARNEAGGLWVSADIADTALGRDAATLARSGAARGLSVGFRPIEDAWNKTRDTVTRVKATLGELSITHMPAYSGAGMTTVREEPTMSDTDTITAPDADTAPAPTEYATREEISALRDRILTMTGNAQATPRPQDPAEFFRAYKESLVTRAWTNVTVDGTASDVSPVPDSVSARIDHGRPTWAAIGAQPLPAEGMEAIWMLDGTDPAVGTQATEKTEIASGPANGAIVKTDVVTIAGGNDLSMQFIQRAHGWTLADYLERLGDQYAAKTNDYLIAQLIAGKAATGVTLPATIDTAGLGTAFGAGAGVMAGAIRKAPNLVILEPATFFEVGLVAGVGYPVAGGNVGNADLASLSYTAWGLRFLCEPALVGNATVKGFFLNTGMVGAKESPGAPYSLNANVPSKVGQDIAVYGYAAAKVLRAGGVMGITRAATK